MGIKKKWEHFSHKADIGIRGYGLSLAEAFEMGALALTGVMLDPNTVKPRERINISCTAPDHEILFVDWLNNIIYEMETRNVLFSEFHVEIHDLKLQAIIKGEVIDRIRHRPVVDVKGATYTELKVYHQNHYWIAQCVVDV